MRQFFKTHDGRLDADNFLFEMSIEEYYDLTRFRLRDNRYQRKRVKNSSTVYALLKKDLIEGCLMPPIILAYEGKINDSEDIVDQIKSQENKILILDGLQRSYTISELVDQHANSLFDNKWNFFKDNKIRVELYTSLNRSSLLYRMLTLNTGQTRMSTRHQIEIIYSDYLDSEITGNIRLITASDNHSPSKIGEYSFRDVVEGFTSYLTADYLLLDRSDLLENIQELERLSNIQSLQKDLFVTFIECYNNFIKTLNIEVGDKLDMLIQETELNEPFTIFGRNAIQIFNKSQALTGFGCAIARLKKRGDITNMDSVYQFIDEIEKGTMAEGLLEILRHLNEIRPHAKKIGNDQRFYFSNFFTSLFSKDIDFRSIPEAAKYAWHRYAHEFIS